MANYTPNITFSSGEFAASGKVNNLLANVQAIFPVGALVYMHQPAPSGNVETTLNSKWIQCNGAVVSRMTYATLFTQFGSADVYGGGNGSTTFGLPDLRGRPPVAIASSGHADVNAFGKNDGAALASRTLKHAHTFANSSHGHSMSGSTGNEGDHLHAYTLPISPIGAAAGGGSDTALGNSTVSPVATSSEGSHTHSVSASYGSATTVSAIGSSANLADSPAYIVAGCWYMAFQ